MNSLSEIKACEDRLKQAMLSSDVLVLDELLAPELIFTNHLGQIMTKKDDLEAHRSGTLKISEIILTDQKIKFCDKVIIISVLAEISGSYKGERSQNDFRFTRVWKKSPNEQWQVIVGHSCIVVGS